MENFPYDVDIHHLFILREIADGKEYIISGGLHSIHCGAMYDKFFKEMIGLNYIVLNCDNKVCLTYKGLWMAHLSWYRNQMIV